MNLPSIHEIDKRLAELESAIFKYAVGALVSDYTLLC